MHWERDIFFDVSEMTLEEKKSIIKDAFAVCDNWKTDVLDCSVSFTRQSIDMTFDETLDLLDDSCHFVVINRKGYSERFCGEIGFCTMDIGKNIFLFIYTSEEALEQLVSKHKLKKRE
jgi:hypothetical protein